MNDQHRLAGRILRVGKFGAVFVAFCVLFSIPAPAATQFNFELHLTGTSTFTAFGGSGCFFVTFSSSTQGDNTTFGEFTQTATFTIYFGVGGVFPTGAVDPTTGAITGLCLAEFGSSTTTFADGGTFTGTFQGRRCCAADPCSPGALSGPPFQSTLTSSVTSGTGEFAGVTGTSSTSCFSAGGTGFQCHGNGALLFP